MATLWRMQCIRGTTAEWGANDIAPLDGELCVEELLDGNVRLKVGDGANPYSALPYAAPGLTDVPTVDVTSVHGRTGDVVGVAGDYTADLIAETASRLFMTPAEVAKLAAMSQARNQAAEHSVSGLIAGGVVTSAGGTLINIAAGNGVIVDGYTLPGTPVYTARSWNAIAGTSVIPAAIGADDSLVYVGITSAGTKIVQSAEPTGAEWLENIWLARVLLRSDQAGIAAIVPMPRVAHTGHQLLRDHIRAAGEVQKTGGGQLSANGGGNLSFDVSALALFGPGINWQTSRSSANSLTVGAQSPASLVYMLETGAVPAGTVTAIDPTLYEPAAGVTTAVGIGSDSDPGWTSQLVYMTPAGVAILLYGSAQHADQATALAALEDELAARVLPDELMEIAAYAGAITVLSTATDLSVAGQAAFTTAAATRSSVGGGALNRVLTAIDVVLTNPEVLDRLVLLEDSDGLYVGNAPASSGGSGSGGGGGGTGSGRELIKALSVSGVAEAAFLNGVAGVVIDDPDAVYRLDVIHWAPDSDDVEARLELHNGSAYQTTGYNGQARAEAVSASADKINSVTAYIPLSADAANFGLGNAAGENYSALLRFRNLASASHYCQVEGRAIMHSASTTMDVLVQGLFPTAAPLTGFRLYLEGNATFAGIFLLWKEPSS